MTRTSGVDMALGDLKARNPMSACLSYQAAFTVVLGQASFPPLRTPERIETETKRAIEHGYHAINYTN